MLVLPLLLTFVLMMLVAVVPGAGAGKADVEVADGANTDACRLNFIRSIPVTPTARALLQDTSPAGISKMRALSLRIGSLPQAVQPCLHVAEELRNWCLRIASKSSLCLRTARKPDLKQLLMSVLYG